jgi:hypothetical protein
MGLAAGKFFTFKPRLTPGRLGPMIGLPGNFHYPLL